MKLASRTWYTGLLVLILAGLLVSILLSPYNTFTTVEVRDFPPSGWAKPQKVKGRIWRNVDPRKVFSIYSEQSLRLHSLGLVKLDHVQNIYVLDYGDVTVKKFSPDGTFLKRFGGPSGRASGQFVNPTDFSVDGEMNLLICDPKTRMVSLFNGDGSLLNTLLLQGSPYRICSIRGGIFVTELVGITNHWFEMYNITGDLISNFGENIIPGETKFPILLAGYLATDGQSLFHAFSRLGYFFSFNITTEEVAYATETIGSLPGPRIRISHGKKGMWAEKSSASSVSSMSVDDTLMFTKAGSIAQCEFSVVDAYSARNGSYLYSFKIPERTKSAWVSKTFFYGITDTSISKWQITLNDQAREP